MVKARAKMLEGLMQSKHSCYFGDEFINNDNDYSTALNLISLHCASGVGGNVDKVIEKMCKHCSDSDYIKEHLMTDVYLPHIKAHIKHGTELTVPLETVLQFAADYFVNEVLIDRSVLFMVKWLKARDIPIEGEASIVKETSMRQHTWTKRYSPIEDYVDCWLHQGESITDSRRLLRATGTRKPAIEAFKKEVVWTI